MQMMRNILAVIGAIAVVTMLLGYTQQGEAVSDMVNMADEMAFLNELDPKAREVYAEIWQRLKQTGNSAEATVWKFSLEDGISPEDAEESMKLAANEHNIRNVGELPLSEQVTLETGEKQRFLKIYQYCNPQTAMLMADYSDAFAAYLPCRIAMVEDKTGQYHLYSLNMDMMIYGGKTLPDELREEAIKVKDIMLDIMKRGAAGDL